MAIGSNAFPGGAFDTAGALAAFFKVRYKGKVQDILTYEKPTLGMIKRSEGLTGIKTVLPVKIDNPQGMSAVLAQALSNATSSVGRAWGITPATYYAGLQLDARTMMASKNDEGAYLKARANDYEGLLTSIGQELEQFLWRDGSGSMGQVDADPGVGTTVQLATVEDSINFHIGMRVLFYADVAGSPSGAPRDAVADVVSAVNHDTGLVTFALALDAAILATDHMVREGNLNACMKGIPAWIPAADPSATPFFDMVRSDAPQMLGGWRQTWLGTIEETAKKLDSKIRRISQRPKCLWLSFSNFLKLEAELGTRAIRYADGGMAKFGRPSLAMVAPGGTIEVKAGPFVPEDSGYLLDMSTWELMSLGEVPHVVQDDGLTAIRIGSGVTAEDGIEIRFRYFAQLVCHNPYANGRFPISY